jgi:hypothetical protein
MSLLVRLPLFATLNGGCEPGESRNKVLMLTCACGATVGGAPYSSPVGMELRRALD